jgi:hypothetical protein
MRLTTTGAFSTRNALPRWVLYVLAFPKIGRPLEVSLMVRILRAAGDATTAKGGLRHRPWSNAIVFAKARRFSTTARRRMNLTNEE